MELMELVELAAGILVLAATIGLPLWMEKSPERRMAISGLAVVFGAASSCVGVITAFGLFDLARDRGLRWFAAQLLVTCGAGAAVGGVILFVVSVVALVMRHRKTRGGQPDAGSAAPM